MVDWCCCLSDHWPARLRSDILGCGAEMLDQDWAWLKVVNSKNGWSDDQNIFEESAVPPSSLAFLPYPCWLRGVVSHDICLCHERRGTVCNELDQGMSSGRLHLSPSSQHRMVRFCFCSMHSNVNGNNIPHLSNSPKEIDLLGYLLLGCLKSPVTRNTFSSKLPELNCLQLAAPCNMILGFGRNGVLWRRWTRQAVSPGMGWRGWDGLDGLGWPLTGVVIPYQYVVVRV